MIPALNRRAWLVIGAEFANAIGHGMTLPFLLVYLHEARGIDLAVAGLAVSMVPVGSLAGTFLCGIAGDRLGARNTLIGGVLIAATGTLLVTTVRSPASAFGVAVILGLGSGIGWPAQDSLLASVVAPEQRSSAFSLRYATLNLGIGIGSLAAAAIVREDSAASFVTVYLIDAGTYLAIIPLLLLVPNVRAMAPERTAAPRGFGAVFRDRAMVRVWLLTALLIAVGLGQLNAGFAAYATGDGGIGAGDLALAFVGNTAVIVVAQLLILRRMRGRRRTTSLAIAAGLYALSWAVTIAAAHVGGGAAAVAAFTVAMLIFGLGETFQSPSLAPIVNHLAPDHLRARYNAASSLAWTTGSLVSPAIAGLMLDAGAGDLLFTGLIAGCALAAVGAVRLSRHLTPEANLIET